MRKPWTFEVKVSEWMTEDKRGQRCYMAGYRHGTSGGGCGYDTREEAEQHLYRLQRRYGIPDGEIEWIGLEPNREYVQLELF